MIDTDVEQHGADINGKSFPKLFEGRKKWFSGRVGRLILKYFAVVASDLKEM